MLNIEMPDGVEQKIADAVLSSVVGDAIREGVERIAKKCVEEDWDSPVRRAVQDIASDIVKEMLNTPENRELVRKHVMAAFQDERLIRKLMLESFREHV